MFGCAPSPGALPGAVDDGRLTQVGALAALTDKRHMDDTIKNNREGMAFIENAFRERGLTFVPSHANFILVKTGSGDAVFRDMLKLGVIVRAMSGYKLPDWIRISIGTPEQNRRCIEALDAVLATAAVP